MISRETTAIFALFIFCSNGMSQLISDFSFEANPIGTQIGGTLAFETTGVWTIDAGVIRDSENGIAPFNGSQMLQFVDVGLDTSIYQLVDVQKFSTAITNQRALAIATAFFNSTVVHEYRLVFLTFEENALPVSLTT